MKSQNCNGAHDTRSRETLAKDTSSNGELLAELTNMNGLEPSAFLECYKPRGLYCPVRRGKLPALWHKVVRNWRRARHAKEELLRVSTYEDQGTGDEACLSSWRSTHSTWAMHHVFSVENPLAASSVLLADASMRAQAEQESTDQAFRSWLGPTDRFSRGILGSIGNQLGLDRCSIETLAYVRIPYDVSAPNEKGMHTVAVHPGDACRRGDLIEIAWAARGRVFAIAEELEHDDINLEALDETYRLVGLRRYRSIWMAYAFSSRGGARPVGAVMAYRGPLGLDFRFLENRCELLTHPTMSTSSAAAVAGALLRAAAPAYDELDLDRVPVIVDERTAAVLVEMGGEWKESCELAIILRSGYPDWCRHLREAHSHLLSNREDERRRSVHRVRFCSRSPDTLR